MRSDALSLGIRLIVVSCGLSCAITGCDLLQTREPQPPSVSGSTFIPPTSPDIVISNLQFAIKEKNKENYRRCLVDTNFSDKTFQFQPTVEAAAKYAGVFTDWTVISEEQYFKNLSESKTDGFSQLDFFNAVTNSQTADEVVFNAKYHFIFQHQNNNIAKEAHGNLQFSIARDRRSTWSIYRWIDVRDTSEVTWSDFKATFRQ